MGEARTSDIHSMRFQDSRGAPSPRRGPGFRRLLLTLLVLSGLSEPRPVSASHFKIEFDDRAALLVTKAFERRTVDSRLADEIVQTTGYRLLFDQVAAQTHPRRDPDAIAAEFRSALTSSPDGSDAEFGLTRARANTDQYREALREFRRVSRSLQYLVTARLKEVLPPVDGFESTAHLIVGGNASGFAFSDRNDISLRFDDFVGRTPDESLDMEQLASTLCHELFHVGFRLAGGSPPRPEPAGPGWVGLAHAFGPEIVGEIWRASELDEFDATAIQERLVAWVLPKGWNVWAVDRYIALLSRLQNEGSAVYADVPLRDIGGSGKSAAELRQWMQKIDEDFAFLAHVTERFASGAHPQEIDDLSTMGFRNSGPLYRVGYRMAERIDKHSGRRPFLGTVEHGPLEFFETYFESHPYGPGTIDSQTAAEIKTLIREVRAVGDFDPTR